MPSIWTKGLLSFALLTCVTVAPAGAALIDRGNGLIYDDDLNITWLEDANLAATNTFGVGGINTNGSMSWTTANSWIAGMNAATYKGFHNWRLPTTTQPDATCGSQLSSAGLPDQGFGAGCTGSEMGHLSNVEGVTSAAPGVFDHVQTGPYWSGMEFALSTNDAWDFSFNRGSQGNDSKGDPLFGWAVRSGDVSAPPVPEPSTMLLLGSGLVGLIGWQRARRG